MKKSILTRALLFTLVMLGLAAYSTGSREAGTTAVEEKDVTVLEMVWLDGSQTFTMADIKAMPSVEGWGGSHPGLSSQDHPGTGLRTIL